MILYIVLAGILIHLTIEVVFLSILLRRIENWIINWLEQHNGDAR